MVDLADARPQAFGNLLSAFISQVFATSLIDNRAELIVNASTIASQVEFAFDDCVS